VIQFTCVVGNPAFSSSLAYAAKELDRRFKGEVALVYFLYSRRQRLPEQQTKRLEENIKRADVILTSMVFEGQPLDLIRKFGSGKTVIVLSGTPQALALTRLGKFNFSQFLESAKRSRVTRALGFLRKIVASTETRREVRTLLDHLDTPLKILRFGKWKDAGNYLKIFKYSVNRGDENFLNLFLFVLKEYFDYNISYKEPRVVPAEFCYHPKASSTFDSTADYLKWYRNLPSEGNGNRPLVGLLTSHDQVIVNDYDDVKMLIEQLEKKGVGVLPITCNATNAFKAIQEYFVKDHRSLIDAMVSLLNFRLEGGPLGGDYEACLAFCQQMNVPLIKHLTLGFTSFEEWRRSPSGLTPIETTLSLCLPELDGLIEGRIISAKKDEGTRDRPVKVSVPINERIERASTRVANWVALRKKKNAEKKIAFILYNYPPGKDRVGNAASLSTPESLIAILDQMQKQDYNVHGFPRTRHEFIRLITKKNLLNQANWATLAKVKKHCIRVPKDKYFSWFKEIPLESQERMVSEWGDPPGSIMADEEHLFIPGLSFGNIFVGFQPARGYHEDTSKITHDQALPPHHQYLAFYRWVEREFEADAVVHVGTHGTLEFLPGKQMAMAETCYPDMLIGGLVNIYIYLASGIAEGMIARRRTSAALLNHMTPPLVTSRLYERLLELEGEIQNYYPLKESSPGRAEQALGNILAMAKEQNLVELEAETVNVDQLYSDIFDMKGNLLPKGNHILGRCLKDEELEDYIVGILRYDRASINSVPKILGRARGIDWDEGRLNPSTVTRNGVLMGVALEQIEQQARAVIRQSLKTEAPPKKWVKKYVSTGLSKDDLKTLEASLSYGRQLAGMLKQNREIDELLRYLSGEFISPGVGGDPVRDPNVIPTGRNMYQFNPELIPTPLACERGAMVADQVLQSYQEMNKTPGYPETVGVVLWGLETMRTQGETVGEIMSLIGVKPIRSNIGQIVGIAPVPLKELERPRLDVLVEISGIFRDTLPEMLKLLDRAFRMVASLPEPEEQNYIKKHCRNIKEALVKKGMGAEEAEALTRSRIFGPSREKYATDVTNLIETSEWENEEEISNMHLSNMSHIYGDTFHGDSNVSTFEEVLNTVDIVSQVRDTDERGITDLDHYYEFLGGLSRAAETVRRSRSSKGAAKVITVVPDTTRKRIETRDIQSQVKLEARTRLLNPQWSRAMVESGYQGVTDINDRLQNLLGWSATTQAVDSWVYSQVAERYLFDEEMRKKMMLENIWSVEDSLKRLMEAYQRGIWDATDEEIDKLKKIYLELESEIEEREE
jgi:cobaltochelatase CobN